VTADTNVLVRAIIADDARQTKIAQGELARADVVAIALPALCEFVWVLSQGYKVPAAEISQAVRLLVNSANVIADRPAVEAGLAVLEAGGDFADGVIAFQGRVLGGDVFVSFDREAVKLLERGGEKARLL
jgi:predicted nucleic-acid-binding protein